MPDPLRKTLSATQTPALFGASPYLTRWMLLRHFIHGDSIDSPEHNRMDWGKRLQPLVLAQAAEDLRLEVRPNEAETYVRRGLLGCTRDAEIICPDRGPGSLETKCVFDYSVWMQAWNGGKTLPRHNEIQLQQQMMVGDGERNHEWGIMAVWVCGEMKYFERKIIDGLWAEIKKEAALFFADVEARNVGEPFGEPVEMPLLAEIFPVKQGTTIDLSKGDDAHKWAQLVCDMEAFADARKFNAKSEEGVKAKIKARIADAEETTFLHGIKIKQKRVERAGYSVNPSSYTTLSVFVPEGIKDDLINGTENLA